MGDKERTSTLSSDIVLTYRTVINGDNPEQSAQYGTKRVLLDGLYNGVTTNLYACAVQILYFSPDWWNYGKSKVSKLNDEVITDCIDRIQYTATEQLCTGTIDWTDQNKYSNNRDRTSYQEIDFFAKGEGYTIRPLKQCNACLDNGDLINISDLATDDSNLPKNAVVFKGTFYAFENNTLKYNVTYRMDIDYNDKNNVFPKYYKGKNISLSNLYYRCIYEFGTEKGSEEDKTVTILVDNGNNQGFVNAGTVYGQKVNNQGSAYNTEKKMEISL